MNKLCFTLIAFFVLNFGSIFAGSYSLDEGQYNSEDLTSMVNSQLEEIKNNLNDNDQIKLLGKQNDLARGFGNTTADKVLNGVHINGFDASYGGVSIGQGGVFESPQSVSKIPSDIENGNDTYTGLATGPLIFNAFFIADNIGLSNFIFELRGGIQPEQEFGPGLEDLTYSSSIIGLGVRYRLLRESDVHAVSFMISDIVIGTGFFYSTSILKFESSIDEAIGDNESVRTEAESMLKYEINSYSFIFPLELLTSVKLGFLNLIGGVGADFVYGQTTIDVSADSTIDVYENEIVQEADESPSLNLKSAQTKEMHDLFRPKLISGLAIYLSPTTLAVPLIYYPLTNGYSLSILAGVHF